MNPIVAVLIDAQVKSFQRRTKSGSTQVGSFERQGQPKSPEEKAANRQSIHALKSKVSDDERIKLVTAARQAKRALKKQGNTGLKLARAFYQMKDQLLNKYGLNSTKKVAA
jgi:hypothetical protein